MEEVECSECGHRYDSQTATFCPRCGNDGRRARSDWRPVVTDPRARRARIAGVILVTLGAFALVQGAISAIAPQSLADEDLAALGELDFVADQPGGDLSVRFFDNGTVLTGPAALTTTTGDVLVAGNLTGGWLNATGLEASFGNITYNGSVVGWFYVPLSEEIEGQVDVADAPGWVAAQEIPATRIIAGFIAFFAAFVVLGGVAAIRLRWWRLAIGGAILAVLPAFVMVFAVPIAGLVLALPTAAALVMIVQGRRQFQ